MSIRRLNNGPSGYVSVFVLLTGMVLVLITLSLLTRQVNEVKGVQSHRHNTQAHYLASSAMDMALWQLYQWSEEALLAYEEGVALAEASGAANPALKDYVQSHLVHRLYLLNAYDSTPWTNPLPDLEGDHGIRYRVAASIDEAEVTITAQGIYQKARVTQQAVVRLPRVEAVEPVHSEGQHGNIVTIRGFHLISRFQTASIWY